MRTLLAAPRATLSLFEKHLRPVPRLGPGRLARLIATLDDRKFSARQRALKELADLGELAEMPLRRALENRPSLEARRRMEELLDHLERCRGSELPPAWLRTLRALEVLERLGTPEACRLLRALAAGEPEARLTRQAQAALNRLGGKPTVRP